jgi:hypothetical protein
MMPPKTSKKRKTQEFRIHVIPTENDVLCGRGRTNFFHEGNKRFREIVGQNLQQYLTALSRSEKSRIVKGIAQQTYAQGARFLKQDKDTSDWYKAGILAAQEKVSL